MDGSPYTKRVTMDTKVKASLSFFMYDHSRHLCTDIVTFLLNHGANINDTGGQYCDNITPIHDAAINGHFEVVQILLNSGANPNITSVQVGGPLPFKCEQNQSQNSCLEIFTAFAAWHLGNAPRK